MITFDQYEWNLVLLPLGNLDMYANGCGIGCILPVDTPFPSRGSGAPA